MTQIRGMMACSLDGFAADEGGGVGWLAPFEAADWGYADFIAEIGTVVLGRKTYEQTLTLARTWPYQGKRGLVLGRDVGALPDGVTRWPGDLAALAAHVRAQTDGDAWVVGGPGLQAELMARGALDRLQLCIVPCLLGCGLRVFPKGALSPHPPRLVGVRALPLGMAMLDYRF